MFSSRLQSLIDGYLESRQVTNFKDLRDLLLCDRIKPTLNESLLRYILAIEAKTSTGWLPLNELTASIDTYISNHVGRRPHAGMLTSTKQTNFGQAQQKSSLTHTSNSVSGGNRIENKFGTGCFVCGCKSHFKRDCPKFGSTTHKANRCVAERRESDDASVPQVDCQDNNLQLARYFSQVKLKIE